MDDTEKLYRLALKRLRRLTADGSTVALSRTQMAIWLRCREDVAESVLGRLVASRLVRRGSGGRLWFGADQ